MLYANDFPAPEKIGLLVREYSFVSSRFSREYPCYDCQAKKNIKCWPRKGLSARRFSIITEAGLTSVRFVSEANVEAVIPFLQHYRYEAFVFLWQPSDKAILP